MDDCKQDKKDEKEAFWQLMKTTDKFEFLLLGYIETGKLAKANLGRYEERSGLSPATRVSNRFPHYSPPRAGFFTP